MTLTMMVNIDGGDDYVGGGGDDDNDYDDDDDDAHDDHDYAEGSQNISHLFKQADTGW